jgi:ferrous iron transport protein A
MKVRDLTMALAMMIEGETKIIKSLLGKEDVKRHLQDIGFVMGEEVKVLSENKGGMVLLVKGVKIALNKALASKIIVS